MTAKQLIITLERMIENFGDQIVTLGSDDEITKIYYESAENESELPQIVLR